MKPVIIYSLPRSRSTAALQACRRNTQFNEPFDLYMLDNFRKEPTSLIDTRARILQNTDWQSLKNEMSNGDSVSKFFGTSLVNFPPAQKWFHEADQSKTHDIFVLLRSPREIVWSFVLALKFGFDSLSEIPAYNEMISEHDLLKADVAIDSFLRFYPTNGVATTFDDLPEEYFDYSKIMHKEQNSMEKKRFVQNLEETERKIDLLLEFRKDQWYEKTNTDIFF